MVVLAPGGRRRSAVDHRVEEFKRKGGIVVESAQVAQLPGLYTPDFATGNPAIGFIHRKMDDADIYFVANTSNQPVRSKAQVRVKGRHAEWWDPFTGRVSPAGDTPFDLDLQPYESRVVVFRERAPGRPPEIPRPKRDALNLS